MLPFDSVSSASSANIIQSDCAYLVEAGDWVKYKNQYYSVLYPKTWVYHSTGGSFPLVSFRDSDDDVVLIDFGPIALRPEASSVNALMLRLPGTDKLRAELKVMSTYLASSGQTVLESKAVGAGRSNEGRITYLTSSENQQLITETYIVAGTFLAEIVLSRPARKAVNAVSTTNYSILLDCFNIEEN